MVMEVEDRLLELGFRLPDPPEPAANYVSGVLVGDLLFVSGNIGEVDGHPKYLGKVGMEVTPEQAYEVMRDSALNHLARVKAHTGDLNRIKQVVRLTGYVNVAPTFTAMAKVTNGASDLLVNVFGDRGKHARVTVGVAMLARNAPVESELIVQLRD